MVRKGQAALEFLMTYGWAILVVLVVIGALAYFGVFNTDAITPEKCNLGTGIGCNDYQIYVHDVNNDGFGTADDNGNGIYDDYENGDRQQVSLSLTNGMGKAIRITDLSVTFKKNDGTDLATCYVYKDIDNRWTDADGDTNPSSGDYYSLNNGDSASFDLASTSSTTNSQFCTGLPSSSSRKLKGEITMKYYYAGSDSSMVHTQKGELMAKIEN